MLSPTAKYNAVSDSDSKKQSLTANEAGPLEPLNKYTKVTSPLPALRRPKLFQAVSAGARQVRFLRRSAGRKVKTHRFTPSAGRYRYLRTTLT